MTSAFIDPEQELEVKIAFTKSKADATKMLAAESKEKLLEEYPGEIDLEAVVEHTVYFRLPTFLDNTMIVGAAMTITQNGMQVNPTVLRLKRMSILIKKWTLKGVGGKEMRPGEAAISQLHPVIAAFLGEALENKLDAGT
jgi:hypothetical protein